jgi:hypothetical protein
MNMNNATASINCNDLINLQAGGKRKTLKKKSLKNTKTQKGGGKKKSGGKRNRGKVSARIANPEVHPGGKSVTTGLFGGLNVGVSADELIDEYKNYPLDSFVTNVFNELRVADPTDKFSYNTKILSLINSMLDKGMNQFQRDQYFIDLRHNYAQVVQKQGADQYRDVDTADLLNVLKEVVKVYIQKSRPTIKVESASRKVAQAVNDFKKLQEQSCPPLNEPHKTERFIDPDGYFGCRMPIARRSVTEAVEAGGPDHCPPFPGSRRTQFHVTYDNKGVCREPIRTGEHHCPADNGDPMATIHETLPGGVGVCKRPFEVPAVITDERTVLPTSLFQPGLSVVSSHGHSGGGVRRKNRSKKVTKAQKGAGAHVSYGKKKSRKGSKKSKKGSKKGSKKSKGKRSKKGSKKSKKGSKKSKKGRK